MEPSQGCSHQSLAKTERLCFHKVWSGAAGPEDYICGDCQSPFEKGLFSQMQSRTEGREALLLHRLNHGDNSEALPSLDL